jgi:hypothetical protein
MLFLFSSGAGVNRVKSGLGHSLKKCDTIFKGNKNKVANISSLLGGGVGAGGEAGGGVLLTFLLLTILLKLLTPIKFWFSNFETF